MSAPGWAEKARDTGLNAGEMAQWALAVSIGVAALSFVQQPETLPVFLAWLRMQKAGPDPDAAALRRADRVLTATAASAFAAADQMRRDGG